MKRKLGFLVLLFAVGSVIVGCSYANEQFVQGTWYYKDPHLNSVSGQTYLEIEWTFDRGTFEYYSCCFGGKTYGTGQYRVVESKDDILTLELYNQRGSILRDRTEIRLMTNRDEDTLTIQGGGPFTRISSRLR